MDSKIRSHSKREYSANRKVLHGFTAKTSFSKRAARTLILRRTARILVSIILALCLGVGIGALPASGQEPPAQISAQNISATATTLSYASAFNAIADADTSTSNTTIFAAIPENNGRVWTDKSVNASASAGAAGSSFDVTLSAMSQSVQSQQQQSVPSDTVFILDTSFSMIGLLDTGESRVAVMIDALNEAIATLMAENPNNRIAVVAYGGAGTGQQARVTPVLALDRYDEITDGKYFSLPTSARIRVNPGITGSKLLVSGLIPVLGGTATQWGIYEGAQMLLGQSAIPTYPEGDPNGVVPKPNIVMLTDGEPTYGWADYDFSDPVSQTGSGYTSGDGNHVDMGSLIMTVLTASYFKHEVTEKYYGASSKQSASFYTIGLGVSDSPEARATLDPMGDVDDDSLLNAGELSTSFDHEKYNMQDVLDSFISTGQASFAALDFRQSSARVVETIYNTPDDGEPIKSYDYVDYYAAAESAADLRGFFKDITQMIVSVGSYPTSVLSDADEYEQWQTSFADYTGAVVFSDVIGEYMQVKDVNYLQYGNKQYNGAIFAHRIAKENPSKTVPAIGTALPTTAKTMDAMFGSQLFFSDIANGRSQAEVSTIIEELLQSSLAAGNGASNGGEVGIYYNSATDFGNRICYFADADGKWTGNYFDAVGNVNTSIPAGTVCAVEQYFVSSAAYNAVSSNPTDLTYSVFQVITALVDTPISTTNFTVDASYNINRLTVKMHQLQAEQQMVRWAIPASLLPVRSVKAAEDGSLTVSDAAAIRYNYSVGLRDGLQVADIAPGYAGIDDGRYYFYSNAWEEPENSTLAHFVPAADNPYYQSGVAETPPSFANNTETAGFATQGPAKVASNSAWYYELGNNGRLEMPVGDLEVTKTWDMPDELINDIYVQLYRDGVPVGTPQLIAAPGSGNTNAATWTGLQVFEAVADGTGNARPVAYTIVEGELDGGGLFVPYGVDGPYQINYSQPVWDDTAGKLVGSVLNSPKGDKNWVLDVSKSFEVDGAPMSPQNIDAILNAQDKSMEFYVFYKYTDPATSQEIYIQMPLGEWGDSSGEYQSRPMLYPDDFASGQRSIWLTGAADDPDDLTLLLVEMVDPNDPIDGYVYRPSERGGTVSVDGAATATAIDNLALYTLEYDSEGQPTGNIVLMDLDTSIGHGYSMTIQPDQTAEFNFVNHLETAPPPAATLSLQKIVSGLDASGMDNFAASFVIEGWESEAAASAQDLSKRVFYESVDWDDTISGSDYTFSIGSVPPGYYTVTEQSSPQMNGADGTIYDRSLSANILGGGSVTLGAAVQDKQTASFTLADTDSKTLQLTNTYTPRQQLTISKTFSPLPSPLPDDIAFSIFDTSGKMVRFVGIDQLSGGATNGGSFTINDLPAGTYTIEESIGEQISGYYPADAKLEPTPGVVLDANGRRGMFTLTPGNTVALSLSFTNIYEPLPQGSLTIKKQLRGYPAYWGATENTTFTAKVRRVEAGVAGQYLTFDSDGNYSGTDVSGSAASCLVNFSVTTPAVLTGIPNGDYLVEELGRDPGANYSDYNVSFEGDANANGAFSLTVDGSSLSVVVANTYEHDTGRIVLTKSLFGQSAEEGVDSSTLFKAKFYEQDAADSTHENTLYFVLVDADLNLYRCVGSSAAISDPAYEGVAVDNVELFDTLSFSVDKPALLDNLWTGVSYRAEELDGEQHAVKYTGNSRTLPHAQTTGEDVVIGNISVEAINTFDGDPHTPTDPDNPPSPPSPTDPAGDPPSDESTTRVPGTGDNSAVLFWLMLGLAVGAIGCGLTAWRLQRLREHN